MARWRLRIRQDHRGTPTLYFARLARRHKCWKLTAASGQYWPGSIPGSADAVTSVIRSRKKSLAAISISVRVSRSYLAKNRRSYEQNELDEPQHSSTLSRIYLESHSRNSPGKKMPAGGRATIYFLGEQIEETEPYCCNASYRSNCMLLYLTYQRDISQPWQCLLPHGRGKTGQAPPPYSDVFRAGSGTC